MNAIEIRYLSVNLTPQVGANDSLIGVRVVPAGRDGNKVYGRSLGPDEPDSNQPVVFNPYAGEELHFEAGTVQLSLRDLDRAATRGPDGYAPISNTIWTWLTVGTPADPPLFRFLFAAARRLDTAHSLHVEMLKALTGRPEPFIKARERLFGALGLAELMCVALGRAVDMLQSLPTRFPMPLVVPAIVSSKSAPLRDIRNAFEHIEDRAIGHVHGKPHPDALSIFDQRDFISLGILRYASHSLDMKSEVPQMLVEGRRALFEAAVAIGGSAKTMNSSIVFPAAPAGCFERVRERAYFLWENRNGSAWWDADSNWFEAERVEAAALRSAG